MKSAHRISSTALFLLAVVTAVTKCNKWNYCSEDGWVPFRRDGAGDVGYSFHACIHQVPVSVKRTRLFGILP